MLIMHRHRQNEETGEEFLTVAEKAFPLAEMLKDALSQNGIEAVTVGSNEDPRGALYGVSHLYEKVLVRQCDLDEALKIAEELFGDDLDR